MSQGKAIYKLSMIIKDWEKESDKICKEKTTSIRFDFEERH